MTQSTSNLAVYSVIVWLFIPEDTRGRSPPASHHGSINPFAFIHTFKEIDWQYLWDVFLVRFLMGTAVMVYRSNFALMLEYKYEASVKVAGYLTSYGGAVGTLSGFFVGKIASFYSNDSKLMLHCGIIQCLALALLTFSPSLWMFALALTPLSLTNQITRVCSTNMIIRRSLGQRKGAVLGLGSSTLSIARMLSPTIGGFAQEYHISGPGLVGTVIAVLAVGVMVSAPEVDLPKVADVQKRQ